MSAIRTAWSLNVNGNYYINDRINSGSNNYGYNNNGNDDENNDNNNNSADDDKMITVRIMIIIVINNKGNDNVTDNS